MDFIDNNDIKFKCVINRCPEKANYNYRTCTNPAYCYTHKTRDMIKIGKYNTCTLF